MDEASLTIAAPPERVWALVTDITRMGEWSPESTGGRWVRGATGPAVGAEFVGGNVHGRLRWNTHCRVLEVDAPHRFSFAVAESRMTWGWRLEPDGTGTRLTQWRERTSRPNWAVRAFAGSGLGGRDREGLMTAGMRRTLAAIKATAEHPPP